MSLLRYWRDMTDFFIGFFIGVIGVVGVFAVLAVIGGAIGDSPGLLRRLRK